MDLTLVTAAPKASAALVTTKKTSPTRKGAAGKRSPECRSCRGYPEKKTLDRLPTVCAFARILPTTTTVLTHPSDEAGQSLDGAVPS